MVFLLLCMYVYVTYMCICWLVLQCAYFFLLLLFRLFRCSSNRRDITPCEQSLNVSWLCLFAYIWEYISDVYVCLCLALVYYFILFLFFFLSCFFEFETVYNIWIWCVYFNFFASFYLTCTMMYKYIRWTLAIGYFCCCWYCYYYYYYFSFIFLYIHSQYSC